MRIGIIYFLLVVITSCDSSDNNNTEIKLEAGLEDCLQLAEDGRNIIAIFTDAKGTVVAPGETGCPGLYTIKGGPMVEGRFVEFLLACNMPENIKKDGLEVTFSGNLYETFDTENICAQSFQISKITHK